MIGYRRNKTLCDSKTQVFQNATAYLSTASRVNHILQWKPENRLREDGRHLVTLESLFSVEDDVFHCNLAEICDQILIRAAVPGFCQITIFDLQYRFDKWSLIYKRTCLAARLYNNGYACCNEEIIHSFTERTYIEPFHNNLCRVTPSRTSVIKNSCGMFIPFSCYKDIGICRLGFLMKQLKLLDKNKYHMHVIALHSYWFLLIW